MNQYLTPLLDALRANAQRFHSPFYTPGHKRGVGISQKLIDTFGCALFQHDLPELTELDNLFAANGVIHEAQQLAAECFGATLTRFLVNGSTCGLVAAILATCNTGDKIILPRNVHSSVISGLILSGANPIFIHPEYDPILDIAHSITPEALKTTLEKHPDAKAVMIVYPTYYGVCGNIQAIAKITHEYNIPLLVDEAHGAHFAFHPTFPTPALKAGADLTVQSIHKTLGAMTQASMLHIQGDRINIDRINKALQLVQSTSPNYILLASLDAARQQMALYGQELMSRTLELAEKAKNKISQIPGLSVFDSDDKTRLTVTVSDLGITGFEAEEILDEKFSVTPELASLKTVTFIISIGNSEEDIDKLVEALTVLANTSFNPNYLPITKMLWDDFYQKSNERPISPREAFFATQETFPINQAIGKICAEIICPYPPGIPILMPGEIITPFAVEYLQQVQQVGGFISGCSDSSLSSIKVLKGNGE